MAFEAIRSARTIPNKAAGGPIPEVKSRVIVPDQISVMIEPETDAQAEPDHEVIVMWVGGVPLYFGAHRENWKKYSGGTI